MSLITHRCTKCGHPDFWQLGSKLDPNRCPGKQWGLGCRVCGRECTPGAPELVDTFDNTGKRVEQIVKPGDPAMRFDIKTCGCDACVALYDELTGAAA
jgi:hypothetical protein